MDAPRYPGATSHFAESKSESQQKVPMHQCGERASFQVHRVHQVLGCEESAPVIVAASSLETDSCLGCW